MKTQVSDGSVEMPIPLQKVRRNGETTSEHHVTPHEKTRRPRAERSSPILEGPSLETFQERIPTVRKSRVEEIRRKIQEGRYRVSLEAVSDRILETLILWKPKRATSVLFVPHPPTGTRRGLV